MVTAKHAEHVIRTRVEMAQRWHGLRSEADILQFVLADPEVRVLDLEVDEATRRQNALVFIRRVECALASGDHAELQYLATHVGRDAFDRFVKILEAR